MTRILIGKLIGFFFGILGFISLSYLIPNIIDTDPLIRWGVLLWYPTVGAIIGIFGIFTFHPMLEMPLPWWFRSPLIGAWMNFVLTFFTYDTMNTLLKTIFSDYPSLHSPILFTLEGAVIGLIIGYLATLIGGEGSNIADK